MAGEGEGLIDVEKAAVNLERIDLDYDDEADVLYLSFGKPREAKDSIEVEDGLCIESRITR
jgi:hypothetical protein